jgi:hypothetical protein
MQQQKIKCLSFRYILTDQPAEHSQSQESRLFILGIENDQQGYEGEL